MKVWILSILGTVGMMAFIGWQFQMMLSPYEAISDGEFVLWSSVIAFNLSISMWLYQIKQNLREQRRLLEKWRP